jgi:hypothetical protein
VSDDNSFWGAVYKLKFDGNGNYTYKADKTSDGVSDEGSSTYSVSSDGLLSFGSGEGMGLSSSDGSAVAWTDTYQDDGYMGIGLGFKKASSMTNASVTGTYYFEAIYVNVSGTYVTYMMEVYFNGDGTLKSRMVKSSSGFNKDWKEGTYKVKSDGNFEAKLNGRSFKGSVRSDARVFSLADLDSGDGNLGMGAGVLASSGMKASSVNGSYIVVEAGFTGNTDSPWTGVSEVTFDGASAYTVTGLYSSDGANHTPKGSYKVGDRGGLVATCGSGIVSSDGQFFAVIDNTASDGTIVLRLGIKE